jgi:hypothetical protein
LLFYISLLGYAGAFSKLANVRIFALPVVIFSFIICLEYLFSLLGLLRFGANIIFVVGLCLALICSVQICRRFKIVNFNAYSCAVYIAAAALYLAPLVFFVWRIPSDFYLYQNDEYSHWALSTKVIATTDALFGADSGVAFKNYPPGTSLFHYYVVRFFGYSETKVLLAHIGLTLAAFAAVFGSILPRRPLSGAVAFLGALWLVYIFDYSFYTINVDLVLGAMFAAAMVLTDGSKYTKSGLLKISLMSMTLLLIKQIGLILALILLINYFGPRIQRGLELLANHIKAKNGGKGLRFVMAFGVVSSIQMVTIGTALVGCFFSWKSYVNLIGGAVVGTVPHIRSLLNVQDERLILTLREFSSRIIEPSFLHFSILDYKFGASLVTLTLVLALVSGVVVLFSDGRGRRDLTWVQASFGFGAVVYLCFLFYCYIAFFSEYESIRLASFERYAGTYYLAWTLVTASFSLKIIRKGMARHMQVTMGVMVILAGLLTAPNTFKAELTGVPSDIGNRDLRNKIKRLAEVALKHAKKSDKAYYIGQASRGYDFLMFRYLAAPLSRGQGWGWSIGTKYYDDDVWTSPDKSLPELVEGYNWLVIGNADEKFWMISSQYFAPKDWSLTEGVFRIVGSRGNLRFEKVE